MKRTIYLGLLLFCVKIFSQDVEMGVNQIFNEELSNIKIRINQLIKSINHNKFVYPEAILTASAIEKSFEKNLPNEDDIVFIKLNDVKLSKRNDNYDAYLQIDVIYADDRSVLISDTLRVCKFQNSWRIDNLGKLSALTNKALRKNLNYFDEDYHYGTVYNVVQYISDRTYIPKAQMRNPFTYELNRNYALNNVNKSVYNLNSEIDAATYTNSVNPDLAGNCTVFTLDPQWKRIVFTKDHANSIKSYGDHQNDFRLFQPVAIDVNEMGEVYVVDMFKHNIYKFIYNYGGNSLTYSTTLSISPGLLISPTDIDYSSNGTAFNVTDDFILVSDKKAHSIYKFSRGGALIAAYSSYSVGGIFYEINSPVRLASAYDYVYFLEGGTNTIVFGELVNIHLTSVTVAKLPTNCNPTDLGVDASNVVSVSDKSGMIHKFDCGGEYLCTYRNTTLPMVNTSRISNSTFSYPGYILLDLDSQDMWTNVRGAKRLYPGAEVINLDMKRQGNSTFFWCMFTDWCYYKLELFKNNQVVKTVTGETFGGGWDMALTMDNSQLTCGEYKFRVSALPYYNSVYGEYGVGWKYREKNFTPLANPVISNLIQAPKPIGPNSNARFTCNLSQGDGPFTYTFSKSNFPSDWTLTSYSSSINYCDVHVGTLTTSKLLAPSIAVICTVRNSCDYYTVISSSISVDPNGCPTLSFEENGILLDENPLLITSMSNPDKDVIDYYLINKPITPVNNIVSFTIHEPQTEHTWFDNISLLETRANPDETIVVNEEGQVINYKGILPARILLNGETDITQNLLELDSLSVELNPGDKLTISRNAVESDGDVVINGEEGIPISKRIPAMLMYVITKKQSVKNDKEIITESTPFTNFFLRPNKSTISKKLRNLPTGSIEITVNKKLKLDYFVFVTDLRTARTRTLSLLSAIHSTNGDVKNNLSGIDQNYSEMYPTERIDLSFSSTTTTGNRAYILKTVGRYVTDTTYIDKLNNLAKNNDLQTIPTENKLYDNYPNPFNPTTNIKFDLPYDGLVQIKVFDILGSEVATLVNEEKVAGKYEVNFNASSLASGVYIYKIQSGSFINSKKMILLK